MDTIKKTIERIGAPDQVVRKAAEERQKCLTKLKAASGLWRVCRSALRACREASLPAERGRSLSWPLIMGSASRG
jgi:hypothetical protein